MLGVRVPDAWLERLALPRARVHTVQRVDRSLDPGQIASVGGGAGFHKVLSLTHGVFTNTAAPHPRDASPLPLGLAQPRPTRHHAPPYALGFAPPYAFGCAPACCVSMLRVGVPDARLKRLALPRARVHTVQRVDLSLVLAK